MSENYLYVMIAGLNTLIKFVTQNVPLMDERWYMGGSVDKAKVLHDMVDELINDPSWVKLPITPATTGVSRDYLVQLMDGTMARASWMNIGGWDWSPGIPIVAWRRLDDLFDGLNVRDMRLSTPNESNHEDE